MLESLVLTTSQWQAMRRHARVRQPQEACGLLCGRDGRVAWTIGIPNAERSPFRFRMQPAAQWRAFQRMEAAGLELVGIYHSHPRGPSTPSATDIAECMYPVAQVILAPINGRWQARAFQIAGGNVTEIHIQVLPQV